MFMTKPRIQIVLAAVAIVALAGCMILVKGIMAQDKDDDTKVDKAGKAAKSDEGGATKAAPGGATKGAAGGAPKGGPPGGGMPGPGGAPGGGMPGAPGGGMPGAPGGGMPGMMGGAGGGGAAGGGLTWSSADMPKELVMSYDEFIVKTAMPRAALPDVYMKDDKGQPTQRTLNEWVQLQRVYELRGNEGEAKLRLGNPGNALATAATREIGVKLKEMDAMSELTKGIEKNFYFEVGYPQLEHVNVAATPTLDTPVSMNIDVVMRVRPGFQKSFGDRVYNALKKFDNPGEGRQKFEIITYGGGFYHPLDLTLSAEAIGVWNAFWASNQVKFTLLGTDKRPLADATTAAGLSAGILAKLVHLDELMYQPKYDLLIPPKDFKFHGGRLNLNYSKGWHYLFHVTVPLGRLATVDSAQVQLILGPAAAGGGGTAAGPGGAGGGPGGPGGMGGMGPGKAGAPGGPGGMPGMPGMPAGGGMGSGAGAPMGPGMGMGGMAPVGH
jgi:hypothetical protein